MAETADATIARMTLVDWLDDLTVRFLLNLPPTELSSVPRLCFQVEEAQWFYEDFIRPANPSLPSLNLKQFCLTLFQHCPLLSGFNSDQHLAAYEEFLAYKVRVPVRGAILMDESMNKALLVRGWKKNASWSFPRGKINKDEPDLTCALREVYEETGYDLRAAGIVERNTPADGVVKSIEVTMQGQHMKLFVFRGVPLDTYFEPRTRKEISKIQWYNVKDLPGAKKQKGVAGQGTGEAQTTKFYMVAPFLGHLKRWISQQRKSDSYAAQTQTQHGRSTSINNNGLQAGITEDEGGETEAGFTTDNAMPIPEPTPSLSTSADELKRLLSIGGLSESSTVQPNMASQSTDRTSDLLAMLQSSQPRTSSIIAHTPFEQINTPFPAHVPETPQPQHTRHPSMGMLQHNQAQPQFPYSPQRLQQQQYEAQRHVSMPAFGQQPSHFLQPQHPGFSGIPQNIQHQMHQQQHSMPGHFIPQQPFQHQHAFQQQPNHYGSMEDPHARQMQLHLPTNTQLFAAQGAEQHFANSTMPHNRSLANAPLGSEAVAPEAAKLPVPKLNAHSMKLLDAFKSGANKATPAQPLGGVAFGQKNQQQATLLDLFRKPSPGQPGSKPDETATQPVLSMLASPAPTDVTQKPSQPGKTAIGPSLSNMAQALPPLTNAKSSPTTAEHHTPASLPQWPAPSPKARRPPEFPAAKEVQTSVPSEPQSIHGSGPQDTTLERPKSRGQLFDPANPQKLARPSSQAHKKGKDSAEPAVSIMQRPPSRHVAQAPRLSTPKAPPKPKPSYAESNQSTPQFSILQRPGSSAGKPLHSPVAQSPLRNEAGLPTQVLKRPVADPSESNESQRQSSVVRHSGAGEEKKGQLLALFAKAPAPTQETTEAPVEPAALATGSAPAKVPHDSQQKLLNLFGGNLTEVTASKPEAPPSPQLQPERKPSRQGQMPQNPQQHLLSLFTRHTPGVGTHSPGTPISPFMLGTPVSGTPPLLKQQVPVTPYESDAARVSDAPKSRLGSMASVMSNGGQSSPHTPTETKDMLLGYLNGVVQKEGYKSAKRP